MSGVGCEGGCYAFSLPPHLVFRSYLYFSPSDVVLTWILIILYFSLQDLHWLTLIATHVTVEETAEASPQWSYSSAFAFNAPLAIQQHLLSVEAQVDQQKTAEVRLWKWLALRNFLLLKDALILKGVL